MDLHYCEERIAYWLRRVKEAGYDHRLAEGFITALRLVGIREGKIQAYAQYTYHTMRIMKELGLTKGVKELTKEDIDRIAGSIVSNQRWSYSTIAIALRTLKRLVHYSKYGIIPEGDGSYCEEVKHIHPDRYKRKAMREEKVRVTDLLTREEFLRMVEAVPKVSRYPLRDRALLYVMYEYAARPSELLNMRVGNVRLYENYAEITTEGKTGTKTLAVVLSYNALREWLEQHPESSQFPEWSYSYCYLNSITNVY